MTATGLAEKPVDVSGKSIFYADGGSGPAVVMLHGGGPGASGLSNYSRNLDALAEHHRDIVPDMPGYGRSSKAVDHSDPFGFLADTIRGLLDGLGLAQAHLVGNSHGGAAALRLALDSPERVGKLVPMDLAASAPLAASRRPASTVCSATTAATGRHARSSPRSSAPTWSTTVTWCPTT